MVDLGTHRGKVSRPRDWGLWSASGALVEQSQFKPWASFVLAFEPDLMLIFVWASLYYAMWYGVL